MILVKARNKEDTQNWNKIKIYLNCPIYPKWKIAVTNSSTSSQTAPNKEGDDNAQVPFTGSSCLAFQWDKVAVILEC